MWNAVEGLRATSSGTHRRYDIMIRFSCTVRVLENGVFRIVYPLSLFPGDGMENVGPDFWRWRFSNPRSDDGVEDMG